MGLKGDLGELPLPDLVEMTSVGGKSGRLVLFDEEDAVAGVLMFRSGRLVGAQSGELTAEKAFYALLGLKTGSFDFDPTAELDEDEVNLPTESLLIEGMRRLDETYRLRRRLPAPAVVRYLRRRRRRSPGGAPARATSVQARAPSATSSTGCSWAATPTSTTRSTRCAGSRPARSCVWSARAEADGADSHAGRPPQPELER